MSEYYTIPRAEDISDHAKMTPSFMRPNQLPVAAVATEYLTKGQCDRIVETIGKIEPYSFHGCNAITRECDRPLDPVLEPIVYFAKQINEIFWNYDLDEEAGAWMQTYEPGDNYQKHTDTASGQMRKLSAVAMLTNPYEYKGGDLRMLLQPKTHTIDRSRGTVVVFQPWTLHEVSEVIFGTRQTINLGFWGPPFR